MHARLFSILLFILVSILFIAGCGDDDDDDDSTGGGNDDDSTDDDDAIDDDDDSDDDSVDPPDTMDDGSFTEDATPFESELDDRIATYLENCAEKGMEGSTPHGQVCVLATDAADLEDSAVEEGLIKIDQQLDCSDFRAASYVRILAKYAQSPRLSQYQYDTILESMKNYRYWMDEPNTNAMNYQTENHSILIHSAAFVLGGLYPDMVFTNSGQTGTQLRAKARHYIDQWLDWRLRFGFTEFHSNVYYNEDIPGLVNLSDFGQDEEIQKRARMALDVMLLDMALNNHEGVFGVAHGRSYMKDKQRLETEDTKATIWLMFGKGDTYGDYTSMSAVALADSHTYRIPPVIEAIGASRPRGLVSKERISLNLADGPDHGIGYEEFDHGVFWWSMNGFVAPEIAELNFQMLEAWDMLTSPCPFSAYAIFKPLNDLGIFDDLIWALYPLVGGNSIQQANTYVYRTPEVMLASAQDYHKAMLGMQTHTWQATLGWDALVFTTYPGGLADDKAAGEWTGGWHPRIGQHRTAAIILYRKPVMEIELAQWIVDNILPNYTHAYFPKEAFDLVETEGNWTFAQFGQGYVALYSQNPTQWQTEGDWAEKELRADGRQNVWICEVGDGTMYGSYETFKSMILDAYLKIDDNQEVIYGSPGQGEMRFSWEGNLLVRGDAVATSQYLRFENPYILKNFDETDSYVIQRGDMSLTLDPENLQREAIPAQ